MAKFICFILLVSISLSLHAQVYRCNGPNGPVYSQMPCAENAERLAAYDPVVEVEDDSAVAGVQEGSVATASKQPTAMENFVATLYRQRQQQMADLDRNIARLQKRLNTEDEEEMDETERASLTAELPLLISERDSVAEQYTTLISEAERRASSAEGAD